MPENWTILNLKEIAEVIDSLHKTPKYSKSGYPMVRAQEIVGGNLNLEGAALVSKEVFDDFSRNHAPKIGDLVFSRVGAHCGKTSFVNTKAEFCLGQNTVFIVPKGIDNKLLYYILSSPSINEQIQRNAVVSSYKTISLKTLRELEICFPKEEKEQKSIASILSALDDKIELNLQMNKTLEEMAMALYKHWFVDFGPFQDGEFVDSEIGEIPKEWEVKPIGDVIETLGGGTPKTKVQEYWKNGTIDWYSPTDLTKANSLFSLGTAKKITEKGLEKSSAKLFPKNSLLMSSRATIGAITINRKEACTNQGFITMIPNDTLSLYQLHGWTVHNMNLIISKANGSTFKEISKTNFRSLPIVVGNEIEKYKVEAKNYYDKIENNILENQTLTQLRDTLLPKLISGEVRVKDVEKTLTEVL
jgi:type I restriction enzyme S subunit